MNLKSHLSTLGHGYFFRGEVMEQVRARVRWAADRSSLQTRRRANRARWQHAEIHARGGHTRVLVCKVTLLCPRHYGQKEYSESHETNDERLLLSYFLVFELS